MTEETKTCDCKEKAIAKLKEFGFIAGAVFVGATLAILLSAQILKPKCPCPRGMMMPPPRMERQLPPHAMHPGELGRGDFHRNHRGDIKARRHHKQFKCQRPDDTQAPRAKDLAPIQAPTPQKAK